jgi:DNA replication protein DnaC
MNHDDTLKNQLKSLSLSYLHENWDAILKTANKETPSYHRFLTDILSREYEIRQEKQRLARIARAHIPEEFVMETFPFSKQPNLKKKLILDIYDSMRFMKEPQELIFIGPTGCGKTGLATAFLIQAINKGYRGYFINYKELLETLFKSLADHSDKKKMAKLQDFDVLLIDDVGYKHPNKELVGLGSFFFELIKKRHRKKTTIFTTQFGFDEWGTFLQDPHITSAILDRLTVQCTIVNMKKCISIRPKNIVHATSNAPVSE